MTAAVRTGEGRDRTGIVLVALVCVSVSGGILLSERLLRGAQVLPLVGVQVVGGALAMTLVYLLLRTAPVWRKLPRTALLGLFQPGLNYLFFFASIAMLPLPLVSMLTSLETLFVLLFSLPLHECEADFLLGKQLSLT